MSEPAPNLLKGIVRQAPDISGSGFRSLEIFEEGLFLRMLFLERKRAERSKRRFVLMLLDSKSLLKRDDDWQAAGKVITALTRSTRQTDIRGWYESAAILGVIFTEIGDAEGGAAAKAILSRITGALGETLGIDALKEIKLSFHVFPEESPISGPGGPGDLTLYPELKSRRKESHVLKRAMDIAGSLCAITLFSPLFLVVALVIKLTSKGPVLFRQTRVGQLGRKFTFLKFRSMYVANDHAIHEEYVSRLIAGKIEHEPSCGTSQKVFKLTNDPRVTPVGRFLRKTSLDELPQFLNVLKGNMSIVGPRPPLVYEFSRYDTWHRGRLAVKPGITGLWQVQGRSKVKFDDMVRMDLEYARSWTPWMDIKIMLRTPGAMFFGNGAY